MKKIMKRHLSTLLMLAAAVIVAAIGVYYIEHRVAPSPKLAADVYPLYSKLSWSPSHPSSVEDLTGYEVASLPTGDISDISAESAPFEKYYSDKLTAAGWKIDQKLQAGGAGSDVSAYTKGGQYIVLTYITNFKQGGASSPAQCPCNVTFSVFSGAVSTSTDANL